MNVTEDRAEYAQKYLDYAANTPQPGAEETPALRFEDLQSVFLMEKALDAFMVQRIEHPVDIAMVGNASAEPCESQPLCVFLPNFTWS